MNLASWTSPQQEDKNVVQRFYSFSWTDEEAGPYLCATISAAVFPGGDAGYGIATKPEDIKFDINMVYDVSKRDFVGIGTWTSEGVVEGASGGQEQSNHVGHNEVDGIRNVHSTGALWDDNDTIEYEAHAINNNGFNPFTAGGNWSIIADTGAYEDLKGQGIVTSSGELNYPCFYVTYEFVGDGHFEPQ